VLLKAAESKAEEFHQTFTEMKQKAACRYEEMEG
jgi:hypothetical protein